MAADRAGHLARIAFEAARIPPERWGEGRLKLLGSGERALYAWILRTFAAGAAPEPDALADAASRFDVDVEEALATLSREDLVHHEAVERRQEGAELRFE